VAELNFHFLMFGLSQAEYTALNNKLGDYVVRLLDKVHGNDELNAILNAGDDDCDDPCRPHGELARLQLAIDCKEKKVPYKSPSSFICCIITASASARRIYDKRGGAVKTICVTPSPPFQGQHFGR